jgi:TPR repeat protein
MYNIGVLYKRGYGVLEDHDEAMRWYTKAAELGNTDAIKNIGILYEIGDGVLEDCVKAINWYKKAQSCPKRLRKA